MFLITKFEEARFQAFTSNFAVFIQNRIHFWDIPLFFVGGTVFVQNVIFLLNGVELSRKGAEPSCYIVPSQTCL
jgi:hypothetical protein